MFTGSCRRWKALVELDRFQSSSLHRECAPTQIDPLEAAQFHFLGLEGYCIDSVTKSENIRSIVRKLSSKSAVIRAVVSAPLDSTWASGSEQDRRRGVFAVKHCVSGRRHDYRGYAGGVCDSEAAHLSAAVLALTL